MKRYLWSALLLTLFSISPVHANDTVDLAGTWHGTLIAAQYNPVDLVFRIETGVQPDDTPYHAQLDIPGQFRTGLPVQSVTLRNTGVTIRMPAIQAEFFGYLIFADDGQTLLAIDGDWNQSGEYVPLRLERRN